MNVTTFSQLISSIGFPIVAYAGLFWYMHKRDEKHAAETENLRQTLENNTQAIRSLVDKLDVK